MLAAACAGAFVITLAAAVSEHGEYFIATELIIIACTAAIATARDPLLLGGLLLIGGLVGAVQLADRPAGSIELIRPRRLGIALRYSVLIALGGLILLLGVTIFSSTTPPGAAGGATLQRLGFGMLVFGYAVRCGLLPFHIGLVDIVEDASPSTAALHAGWLPVLALPVLVTMLETQPELLAGNQTGRYLLIGLGAISALAGGVLGAVGGTRQRLAYLAIANLGLLTIGLGTGSVQGTEAALLGVIGHGLGIALATLGLALVAAASTTQPRSGDEPGGWPAALALFVGVLLLVGVPPFAGFAPKLLLLAAAWQSGWLLAAITVAGITLMALAAGRFLSGALQAPSVAFAPRAADEPAALGAKATPAPVSRMLLALAVLISLGVAVSGIWLLPLTAQLDALVRGFGFLGP